MSQLCCIDGEQLALAATTIAIALSRRFQNDDLNILSSLLSSVADILALIAARQACDSSRTQSDGKSNADAQPDSESKPKVQAEPGVKSNTDPDRENPKENEGA